jgi:hypothetical protein
MYSRRRLPVPQLPAYPAIKRAQCPFLVNLDGPRFIGITQLLNPNQAFALWIVR